MGPKIEEEPTKIPKSNGKFLNCSQRLITSIMGFLCIAVGYFGRVNMSVVLTAIAFKENNISLFYGNNNINNNVYNIFFKYANEYDEKTETFHWNQWEQGNILSAFFIGYATAQLPCGLLSEAIGGKIVLMTGLTVNGFVSLFIHVALLYGGYYAIIICRIFQGLGQACIFPGLSYFLAKWIPRKERGRYGSFVYGGALFGAVIGNFASGLLVDFIHWSAPFYFAALISFVWVITFYFICTNDPLSHPRIKQNEKDYLISEMGDYVKKEVPKKPWKKILGSWKCYAYFFSLITYDFGFYVIAIDLPKFLYDVMAANTKETAIFTSIPFLTMWVCSVLAGFVADALYIRNIFSLTTIRKIMTTTCLLVPAILIYLAGFIHDISINVGLFTIAMSFMGTFYAGIKLNPLDMSPNFAPTLIAFGNGLGACMGFLVPNIIGYMTPNVTRKQWQEVFLLTLCIRICGTIVYVLFSTAEIQPWDHPENIEEPKTSNKNA